jgi:hypothetical protein
MSDNLGFFSEVRLAGDSTLESIHSGEKKIRDRHLIKEFLEYVHIKKGLLEAYNTDYPLIEARELLPSFEVNFAEYKFLPSYSMVVFNRPLEYQQEVFQFDLHHRPEEKERSESLQSTALKKSDRGGRQNLEKLLPHLTKELRAQFRQKFLSRDLTDLSVYEELLDFLFHMDRAHVIARDSQGNFALLGSYASFPSDLDTELKNLGRRIGKFKPNDNIAYESNRQFVYQFLMEVYGFPIASERRTSSALFARKLSRLKEPYLIKVLGSSDRVITSLSGFEQKRNPLVEKVALVSVPANLQEAHDQFLNHGFYIDIPRRVVILKVTYTQHNYNKNNTQEDRALSVVKQEVIHPITGIKEGSFNILKDTKSFLITLNDIIRGEYVGSISYRQEGHITSTKNHDDRLKFLYAWLHKNQRRITGYSKEFFEDLKKVMNNYILNPEYRNYFKKYPELHREVVAQLAYLQQSYQLQHLEKLAKRRPPFDKRLSLVQMLNHAISFLDEYGDDIPHYYDDLYEKCLNILNQLASHPYLKTLSQLENPPTQPYQRTIWQMLARLQHLREVLATERYQFKQVEELGSLHNLFSIGTVGKKIAG